MPDVAAHQQQVAHNKEAIAYLQQAGTAYLDWAVTALFYTALHSVDQVLYHRARLSPRNHLQRHAAIANEPALAPIYGDYRELEHQSRRSRYECARFTQAEVQSLTVRLTRIEETVSAALR